MVVVLQSSRPSPAFRQSACSPIYTSGATAYTQPKPQTLPAAPDQKAKVVSSRPAPAVRQTPCQSFTSGAQSYNPPKAPAAPASAAPPAPSAQAVTTRRAPTAPSFATPAAPAAQTAQAVTTRPAPTAPSPATPAAASAQPPQGVTTRTAPTAPLSAAPAATVCQSAQAVTTRTAPTAPLSAAPAATASQSAHAVTTRTAGAAQFAQAVTTRVATTVRTSPPSAAREDTCVSAASSCTGTRTALSRSSSEATIMPAAEDERVETEAKKVVKHVCPTCSAAFWTNEDVRAHWLREHKPSKPPPAPAPAVSEEATSPAPPAPSPAPPETSPASAPLAGPAPATSAPPASAAPEDAAAAEVEEAAEAKVTPSDSGKDISMMRAKVVEVDEKGTPVIVREEDPCPRTIVTNEDGSHRAFGEAIVKALLAKEMDKVNLWAGSMTDRTLRALVNELSERFFILQRQLMQRREQLKEQQRSRGLALFSLSEDCTAKDLEGAYRRLARSMHPDKNGGTEEAKERFQTMRARYEELKEQFHHGGLGSASKEQAPAAEEGEPERAAPETEAEEEPEEDHRDNEDAPSPKEAEQPAEDEAEEAPPARGRAAGASAGAPGASGDGQAKVFFSRSRDTSVLRDCVQHIVKRMQILHQNLDIVERDFPQASG